MRRLVSVLALQIVACGGDEGGLRPDELDDALISTICDYYVRCGLIDDPATCRTLDVDAEISAELLAAIENGTVRYDEAAAADCLASLAGATCAREGFRRAETDACDRAFQGTVGAGGTCAIDEQCISDTCEVPSCPDACCQGTCVGDTPPPAAPREGESCAVDSSCVQSFCDSTTMLCTAYRQNGQSCSDSDECASGACTGTCVALAGPGEACMPEPGCRDLGTYCSPTSNTCVALGLAGDACGTTAPCSPVYQCVGGACALRPTLGQSCADQDCIDRSFCDPATSLCTAPKADGASCQDSSECQGECDAQTMTCKTAPVCI